MKRVSWFVAMSVAACSCATTRPARIDPQESAPQLSTRSADDPLVIPLEYATAQEVRDVLDELMKASRRSQYGCTLYLPDLVGSPDPHLDRPDPRFVADDRTNSLIIKRDGWSPEDIASIRELVARLDVER